jgi:AraC-like DNA-binding protein/ligand-binding sensor protein
MKKRPGAESGVDEQKLQGLAAEYHAATGLPLVVTDREGRQSWSLGECALCARMAGSRKRELLCRGHHRLVVEEAYRWGEPYISICPLGLVTIAVPLARERRLSGGMVSGFCIFPEMEEDMRGEVRDRIRRLGIRADLERRARFRFSVVPSETLRRDARLLFDLATASALNDPESIAESRERSIQQFTIAGYLQEERERSRAVDFGNGAARDLVTSLVAMQNEIIDKVVVGDLAGSREIINRFLGVIFLESGMNFDMLKVRLLELIVIISRAAMGKGISAEGLLGPRYSYLTGINAATGFDDLFWRVTKALENFTRAVSVERGRTARAHVTLMKEFLSKRFATKVSAREVADAAGLSVSRALHLFHRECGMSLSSWIARQRVDFASSLLRNTERSMADIASECGFFDQSHFTKVFKSLQGVPPLRYRKASRSA